MKLGRLAATATIIGLVVIGIAVVRVERICESNNRYSETRGQIAELQEAPRRYYVDNGYYPTTEEGLLAPENYYVLEGGVWDGDPGMVLPRRHPRPPLDAWGNPFFYQSDGSSYVLGSFGPHGVETGRINAAIVARSPSTPPN